MTAGKRYVLFFVTLSVAYIALGLVLIIAPVASRHIICYILAAAAVLLGIFRATWHFAKDDLSRAFHSDIPTAAVLVIAGIYIFARADLVADWLSVLLGFAVVFDSMIKLQHAFDLKRTRFAQWWGFLAASLVTAVLGVLLIVNIFGSLLPYFFGAILMVDGIANIVTIATFAARMKKAAASEVQAEWVDALPPANDG